jgi:hypothetical protein
MSDLDNQNRIFALEKALQEYNKLCSFIHKMLTKYTDYDLPKLMTENLSLIDMGDIDLYYDKLNMSVRLMSSQYQQLAPLIEDGDILHRMEPEDLTQLLECLDSGKKNLGSSVNRLREGSNDS